jgi:hypothetical protein
MQLTKMNFFLRRNNFTGAAGYRKIGRSQPDSQPGVWIAGPDSRRCAWDSGRHGIFFSIPQNLGHQSTYKRSKTGNPTPAIAGTVGVYPDALVK